MGKDSSSINSCLLKVSQPDVEEITRVTYEKIALEYCQNTPSPEVRNVIVESAAEFAYFLNPESTILVLGAGDGRDAEIFSKLGHRAIMLDYCSAMLSLARRRLPFGEAVKADFRNLPFTLSAFDGAWASACLYHVRKSSLPHVISRVFETLRPGGVFYFNLRSGVGEKLDPHPRSFPVGGARFYAFYSKSEVLDLVSRFDILKLQSFNRVLKEDYFQLWIRKPQEVA